MNTFRDLSFFFAQRLFNKWGGTLAHKCALTKQSSSQGP